MPPLSVSPAMPTAATSPPGVANPVSVRAGVVLAPREPGFGPMPRGDQDRRRVASWPKGRREGGAGRGNKVSVRSRACTPCTPRATLRGWRRRSTTTSSGQVPRGARQAAAAGRQRPVPGADRQVRALRRRPVCDADRARPDLRRAHRRADRRRLLGAVHGRAVEAGRDRRRVHHRERRRRRRRVVLEPLSRRDVRHRGDGVPATARRDRPHADAEVRHGAGDLRARAAHREDVRSLRPCDLLDAGDAPRVGCRCVAMGHPHGPRRPDPRPLRRDGHRAAQPSEAPRRAGYRDVRRPHVPHEPVGLRLHRWRLDRCADDGARRQARRHHRDRCDGGAVHRAARTRCRRAVRVPAHTVGD